MKGVITGLLFSACLVCFLSAPVPARAAGRYFEAEEIGSLLRYPYDNEAAAGWYAREANIRSFGAPGRGYCAAIHANASAGGRIISRPLAEPVPAGKYRLFLRVIGPTSPDRESIVRVGLGASRVEVAWKTGRKNFTWLPGVEITLAAPAASISLEAVQFGGRGYGAYTEPLNRSLWVDTIYLSDDPNEKEPPDYHQETARRAGLDTAALAPRPVYQSDEPYRTPAPAAEPVFGPIKLQSFDGRRNLWPNSSFELGMNDGWAGRLAYAFTDADLDNVRPFHGLYSLKVPAVEPFSRPYYLEQAGIYTISLYVRSEKPADFGFVLKKVIEDGSWQKNEIHTLNALKVIGPAGPEWRRLSATGNLEPGWYYLSLSGSGWVDGVQLEAGAAATEYAPRAELEGALRSGCLGNIIYDNGPLTLDLWFHNSGRTSRTARLGYRVVDVRERVVAEGETEPVSLAGGQTVRRAVAIRPPLRGIFSATYGVSGRELPEGETVYLVMSRPPEGPVRHKLGDNLTLNEAEILVHKRLGMSWVMPAKVRELGALTEPPDGGVHPAPEVWNWQDERAALPRKHGLEMLSCFWIFRRPPDFMLDPVDPDQYRTTRGMTREYQPKLDLWADYAGRVAKHYRSYVRGWFVDDQAENHWDPKLFESVAGAAADAIHREAPGVWVGISATPEFTEELMRYLPPEKIDFFSNDALNYNYHESRYYAGFKRRYQKPLFCGGVGGYPPEETMYHTLYTYQPGRFKAAWMARQLIYHTLVMDLDVIGYYAGVLANYGAHLGQNKPLCDYDATPYPWGSTFGCLGTLMADAELVEEVPLGSTDRLAFIFRSGGRLAAVTYATNTSYNDLHWRPAARELKGVTLACPAGSVEVRDMYWNEVPGLKWSRGRLRLDLDEEPLFIFNKRLSPAAFADLFRKAGVAPVPLALSFNPVTDGAGRVNLRLAVANNSGRDQAGVKVDLRPSAGVPLRHSPLSIAGLWLAPRLVEVGTIRAGETAVVEVPTAYEARLPLEMGYLRGVVTAAGGAEYAGEDYLWLLPAPVAAAAPKADGDLAEWEGRPAAWLAYQRHFNFSYRWEQFLEGEENFGYPSYTLDGRVAFWAAWDKENLYLAARCDDDQPLAGPGEKVRVRLAVAGGRERWLELVPGPTGRLSAALDGKGLAGAGMKLEAQAVKLEAAVPWRELGLAAPAAGQVLTFDLFWTDLDREQGKLYSGTMHWAGGSRTGGRLILAR